MYAKLVDKRYSEADALFADLAAGDSVLFAPKVNGPKQTHRLYYVAINAKLLVYKGHGAIRFTP